MDAYRSELDAAERRLALLDDQIAERERWLGVAQRVRPRWALLGASLVFFSLVTAVAALTFARTPVTKLETSRIADEAIPSVPAPDDGHELPLLAQLERKIENGTATPEEREARHVLVQLYDSNRHLRRSFAAMTRLADDRLAPRDLSELNRYCHLGGHYRCLTLVRRVAAGDR